MLVTCFVLFLAACDATPESKRTIRANEADVFEIDGADREMKAASAKAREELSAFDAALNSGDSRYSHFALKQSFKMQGGREEVWISDITKKDGAYHGFLFNNPLHIKNIEKGDHVVVDKNAIADWMYVERDTLRGGYTKRLLRSRLNEADRVKFDRETAYVVEDYHE